MLTPLIFFASLAGFQMPPIKHEMVYRADMITTKAYYCMAAAAVIDNALNVSMCSSLAATRSLPIYWDPKNDSPLVLTLYLANIEISNNIYPTQS